MIDTLQFFEELKEALEPKAAKKIAEILGKVYRELSNAVTKTEFEMLTKIVSELAVYQKELAEAQKKTEQEIHKLTKGLEDTRQQLGGLFDTVGYTFENEAYKALPELLKRDYVLTV